MQLYLGIQRGTPSVPLPDGRRLPLPDLIGTFEKLGLQGSTVLPSGLATHVFLVARFENAVPIRLECVPPRACLRPWSPLTEDEAALWELRLAPHQVSRAIRTALRLIREGYLYDVPELATQAVSLAAEHFGVPLPGLALAELLPDGGVCMRFALDVFRETGGQPAAFSDMLPDLAPERLARAAVAAEGWWLVRERGFTEWGVA